LLSIIAAVLKPQTGAVRVNGIDLQGLTGASADRFRADHIGMVFQQFNLLPFLSVLENVQLPCRFSSRRREQALAQGHSLSQEAIRLLQAMHLPVEFHSYRSAMQLSVGQQQRVAVARALMGRPSLVIADEPTSSLDADARSAFLELLFSELADSGASLLFVSHDTSLQSQFDRSLALADINTAAAVQPAPGRH
ncbi:MAG: ATP-binding cassette domain-containing protein, partial [Granulosicoccus sp.]|nr:ATP-binding cassette domain-containing protein [Granulosicoccus sp.]